MLKLINAAQTKLADQYTIENEPIPSIELMERASSVFVKTFTERYQDKKLDITIFCGKGNNGGDGLAIARLLWQDNYENLQVVVVDFAEKSTPEFDENLIALQEQEISLFYLKSADDISFKESDIIIDAILGIGLKRGLEGEFAALVQKLNAISGVKVSVDVPTGMPSEGKLFGEIIFKADWVITFQRPKLNFLLPLSAPYIKEWKVVNIGLNEEFIESISSPYYWFWKKDIQNNIRVRQAFEHKGTYGHNLIISGAKETMGAALLAAEASLKTGSGLTTLCIPESGLIALNSRLPEVMFMDQENLKYTDLEKYKAIAIGPGLGKSKEAEELLTVLVNHYKRPIVFDADALNLLANNMELLQNLPSHSVLTPHIKEFDRLFGEHHNCWDRIETAFKEAQRLRVFIVLKNRYTMVFSPEGLCCFNSSGSPAMASGGMGDVLTGMISSFITQGYPIDKAVLMGVYIHGYVGEHLGQKMYVVPPTKLVKQIPYALKELKS